MRCRRVVAALALAVSSALSQAAPIASAPVGSETWLAVTVNGQQLEQVALFLRRPDGQLLAPVSVLRAAHLRAPLQATVSFGGERYVRLDEMAGLTYRIDEDRQLVALDAPARLFDGTVLKGTSTPVVSAPPSPLGGFLNYDLVATDTDGNNALSGLLEASVFGPYGAGVASFLGREQNQQGEVIRLETTWTRDLPDSLTSFRVGDSITGASLWWGGAVRFGGLQWASNYATRPGLITMPLPAIAGEAAVPSSLDMYVNDALRWKSDVQSGPFRVDDVPIVTGEGQIRLVVNDLLGRQQIITESYYASPQLLRSGLQDFSLEAGVTRENFGLASDEYQRPLIVGTDRIGLTDQVTAEVHGELLREQQTLGLAGAFLLREFGVLSASLAGSHAAQGSGGLLTLGFDHTAPRWSFGANAQYATQAFTRLGLLPGEAIPRLSSQVYAVAGLGMLGSLSISRTREEFWNSHPVEIASLRQTINVGALGYLALSAVRVLGDSRDTTYALSITHSLGARVSASSTATADSHGTDVQVDLQQNLPAGRGIGYRLLADEGDIHDIDGTLSLQGDVGTYQVEAQRLQDTTTVQASASGSLVVLGGHMVASREIQDSFALAEVGDQHDVRIYRENQLVGQTNSQGYLLIPGLRAYQDNSIKIEQADLPLDAVIDSMDATAVPYFRSGVILRFPIQRPAAALLSVRLQDGSDLPAGALVQVVGQEEQFPSAFKGEVYVTGLDADNRLRAQWADRSCEFSVHYARTEDPLPRLGPFVCQSTAP